MNKGYAATIGFFDGVHRGHMCLINQLQAVAGQAEVPAMLITFDCHPRQVLQTGYIPQLLSTLSEKKQLLRSAGVDMLHVLHFTKDMAALSAYQFMKQVLHEELGVSRLLMGYDHRFGHGGGTFEEYMEWGRSIGICVQKAEEMKGEHVSSSVIRRCIANGDMEEANRYLGYTYSISGEVVHGRQQGSRIGFPTANVSPHPEKLLPACGAYAVRVWVGKDRYDGMLNVGRRPTMQNGDDLSVEVNLFGFEGNLYGRTLTLEVVRRLRSEICFSSVEGLQAQLREDVLQAMRALSANNE